MLMVESRLHRKVLPGGKPDAVRHCRMAVMIGARLSRLRESVPAARLAAFCSAPDRFAVPYATGLRINHNERIERKSGT